VAGIAAQIRYKNLRRCEKPFNWVKIMAQGRFGTRPPASAGNNPMVFVMGFFFLLFSLVGAALLYTTMSNKNQPGAVNVKEDPVIEMVDVLVPVAPIKAGTQLDPSLFTIEPRPAVNVSSKVVKNLEQIKGMFAKSEIVADQPLHIEFITSKKPTSDIVSKIPRGFRAVTIRVDQTTAVEGWAGPGARVDVVWIANAAGEKIAKVIVEAVRILSYSGQTSRADQGGSPPPSTVTLLVTKEDATKIQLAQTSGRLTLQLRNDEDAEIVNEDAVDVASILNSQQDSSECREARRRGITRVSKPNGEVIEMVLDNKGALVALDKFCQPVG
jgi:pilus assembly protein CpaB